MISLFLWSYTVLITDIDHFDFVDFPIFQALPAGYWAGFVMLILATVVWYLSPKTGWHHFLLLLVWTLYFFVGPEIMEVMARGYDAQSHLLGVTYIDQGRLADFVTYREWPGFVFLSSFLYKATGVGYTTLLKLLEILLPLLRTVFIWYFATRLFQGKKEALLFSLLLLGFFWDPQTFDPSPQHFGILLMLPLVALCFSQGRLSTERRGLIIILFATIVISHGLTSIIIANTRESFWYLLVGTIAPANGSFTFTVHPQFSNKLTALSLNLSGV